MVKETNNHPTQSVKKLLYLLEENYGADPRQLVGIQSLQDLGIDVTSQQKSELKKFVSDEELAIAHNLLLEEFAKEYEIALTDGYRKAIETFFSDPSDSKDRFLELVHQAQIEEVY